MSRETDDPDAEIPTDPITKEQKYYVVSASQIKSWWSCRRKWGWEKLAKLKAPSGRGAGLGHMMHGQLEPYLRDGADLNYSIKDPYGTYPAEVAASGLQYLPKPQSPGLLVEKYFKFEVPKLSADDPIIYVRGYKDYQVAPEYREDGLPHVGDHKSCGNWAYALTADDLLEDVQAIIYAYDELVKYPDAPAVSLQWTYYATKKPYKALPVYVTVSREHVMRLIEEVFVGSRELVATFRAKPEVLALPFNADECGKYGGCPFQGNCNLSPKERRRFSMSTAATTATLTERIAARKAAEAGGAPPAAPALTGIQAKIAARKAEAAKAAPAPEPKETDAEARARVANMLETGETIGHGPDAVLARTMIDEVLAAKPTPAWMDPSLPDPLTGRPAVVSTMPVSDQPINCPTDYQQPPATASTPVEIAPELAAAIATTTTPAKGRPKGTKATKATPEDETARNALINEFLTLGIAFFKAQAEGT